jgi:hypothetical protein
MASVVASSAILLGVGDEAEGFNGESDCKKLGRIFVMEMDYSTDYYTTTRAFQVLSKQDANSSASCWN